MSVFTSSSEANAVTPPVVIDGRAAWRSTDRDGVLSGLRVLDLSRVLAGPYAAQMLADHGADVLKVEAPSGDETRGWGPPFDEDGISAYYGGMNHSKDNICLDLRTEQGREVLGHLLRAADVVVENFKAGTLAAWGFDYESVLAPANPGMIYCRITGFGVDGPMGGLPGYDAVLQSFGGLMSVNGYPEGNPLRVGVPIVDIVAANLAFSGVLLAVLDRTRTGNGQLVDIALLDAVISILHPHAANWTVSGVVPQRTGELHPTVVPYQVFATRDGDFFISAANDRQFASLAAVLGVPEIVTDPRFVANRDRHKHREELIALIAPLIETWRREELGARLTEAGVPCSPVNTVAQALQSPQVRHRELFVERDGYRGIGVPISLGNAKTAAQTPAVKCGAHTVEVLAAMGYDAESIDTLA
ncbi:CoA transferase [Rhodococcus sp. MS16]|uniref:CaiB/BaiF CoA transferase family protein n=1 Tax=Rhodococcus sp. MS16 TaxID=2579941 RepID=UPI001562E22A|nr:CoA transferase [Rhodococcus sp. MS16]NRI69215.1 CoA transferase [Rhodococcus sp. MS16]